MATSWKGRPNLVEPATRFAGTGSPLLRRTLLEFAGVPFLLEPWLNQAGTGQSFCYVLPKTE